jgi:methyl-accepting chemotaxis protein
VSIEEVRADMNQIADSVLGTSHQIRIGADAYGVAAEAFERARDMVRQAKAEYEIGRAALRSAEGPLKFAYGTDSSNVDTLDRMRGDSSAWGDLMSLAGKHLHSVRHSLNAGSDTLSLYGEDAPEFAQSLQTLADVRDKALKHQAETVQTAEGSPDLAANIRQVAEGI